MQSAQLPEIVAEMVNADLSPSNANTMSSPMNELWWRQMLQKTTTFH